MTSIIKIKKKIIKEEILYNIFNFNYDPLNFFKDYKLASYFSFIKESSALLNVIKDYSRPPINIRKGMKANKKFKKRNYKKMKKA
jgi:hypothetical protein